MVTVSGSSLQPGMRIPAAARERNAVMTARTLDAAEAAGDLRRWGGQCPLSEVFQI